MDRKNIATRYQQPTENLLMDIATLAKRPERHLLKELGLYKERNKVHE